MQAEKVQLIATAKVAAKYKIRWLKWWNMSKESRLTYNFPRSPCSIEELHPWVDLAAFWAGVSFHMLMNSLLSNYAPTSLIAHLMHVS